MRSLKVASVVLGIVAGAPPVFSQGAAEAKPSFDIASIKPTAPGTRPQLAIEPGGRFVANGLPLGLLIAIAYHLQAFQMSGADGWLMKDQWSIEAKTPEGIVDPPSATPPYMGVTDLMAVRLRSLLADRFALKTHRETREMQVYELTVSKAGSKLKPVDPPPQAVSSQPAAGRARPPVAPDGTLPENFAPPPGAAVAGPGIVAASAIPMDQIVNLLGRILDQPVIDKTGLTGYFNLRLQFDPATAPRAMGAPPPADVSNAAAPSNDPSIFTAIQQQLGLKLESTKEPVEVLVIDSAQKPTEN